MVTLLQKASASLFGGSTPVTNGPERFGRPLAGAAFCGRLVPLALDRTDATAFPVGPGGLSRAQIDAAFGHLPPASPCRSAGALACPPEA